MQKEQEETIKQILEVVQKKPYPDSNTEHLATFIHALFQVSPRTKQFNATLTKRQEMQRPFTISKQIIQPIVKEATKKMPLPSPPKPVRTAAPNLLPEIPLKQFSSDVPDLPQTPKPKMEYTVLSFDVPIGIISDPQGENNKPTYTVIEPVVNQELFAKIKESVSKDVSRDYRVLDDANYLKDKCEKAAKKLKITFQDDTMSSIKYFLKRDLTGFRKLDPLMQDLNVRSIYIDGVNKPVIVETNQFLKGQTNIKFPDPEDLNSLIQKIAKATGSEISDKKPILETVFQGFKIQAVLGQGNTTSKLIIKKVMA